MPPRSTFFQRYQYKILLVALLLHLYIGIVLTDLPFYVSVVWPANMIVLGVASIGVFLQKGKWKNRIRSLLFLIVLILPLSLPFGRDLTWFMPALSLLYVAFFGFILLEIMRFLIRPGYINGDLISAAACGYFLLIEINVFAMEFIFHTQPGALTNVRSGNPAETYMDLVYFCTITQSTIGYGDITPVTHQARLATSLFGVAGQLYSVILVGILISKFAARSAKP